jgi:quinol monooxygenase YgiN
MIELHLRGRVTAGRRADYVEFLRGAIPYYEGPGGIQVSLLWSVADPDEFIEVVRYADQATHDRDQIRVDTDPTMQEYLRRWRELLAGPPDVKTYLVDELST